MPKNGSDKCFTVLLLPSKTSCTKSTPTSAKGAISRIPRNDINNERSPSPGCFWGDHFILRAHGKQITNSFSNFCQLFVNEKWTSAFVIPISFFKFTEKRMAGWYTHSKTTKKEQFNIFPFFQRKIAKIYLTLFCYFSVQLPNTDNAIANPNSIALQQIPKSEEATS